MEKELSKLEYKHIAEPTKEIIEYINNRRFGIVKSLKTRWKKFNNACMGGIEPNTILTIAGISGSGKSSFANSLETDLFDLNPNEDFVILNFSMEMQSSKQVGRKLSYKLKKTTSQLYTANPDSIDVTDEVYAEILKHGNIIRQYPIYYVDRPGTVEQIKNTIIDFMNNPSFRGKWVVIILDHILLTKGKSGEKEREIIADLQRLFLEVKKWGKTTIIQLSQLNRNIETPERISNPIMHYPVRSDLFGSKYNFL